MLDIRYRDDCLVAINKPAGLLVHRSDIDRHETRFTVQLLRDQIGQRVHPLHRLDKGTSGVLVFALGAGDTATMPDRQSNASVERDPVPSLACRVLPPGVKADSSTTRRCADTDAELVDNVHSPTTRKVCGLLFPHYELSLSGRSRGPDPVLPAIMASPRQR